MIITREKGMRMWGGGSGSTSASGVNGGGGFSLAVTEGEGTGNAYTGFTYESGVLSLIKGEKFVTVDFFNRLFTAYDSDGNAILPNDVTSTINNLKLLVGTWTEEYLSALGKNSEGGGGGGGIELSDVWQSLKTNTDDYANQKINSAHIPDLSGTYATKTWVNQQGFVTSSGVTSVATGTGLTGGTITSTGTISINSTYQTYISNGNTAYGWGNHATAGYALASDVYSSSASRTKNYVLAAPSTANGAATFRKLVASDIPDLSSTYATASRVTTLEGYFTDGVANTAAKLNTGTTTYSAWGQTYWSSGVPQSISGNMTSVGSITPSANGNALGTTSARFNIYGTSGNYSSTLTVADAITLSGSTAAKKRIYFGDTSHYIELTSTGFHFSHGIYSDSFVSALGANSSGGGSGTFDEEAMWTALGTTSTAKVIASSHIPNLAASKITSGTLADARIPSLAASKITSGTFDTARIPNLSASKITSGTFAAARIPIATASAVGGIKVGTTLAISDGVLNQKSGIATAGTYKSVTIDTYGRVTAGTNPSTLAGYGITDAKIASGTITLGSNTITPLTSSSSLAWGKLTGTPTTLSGYGISDAYTKTQVDNALGGYLPLTGGTMTGNILFNPGDTEEKKVIFQVNRKTEGGGGWAYSPIAVRGADSSVFFNISVYGQDDALSYAYLNLGEAYSSANSLRIYNGTSPYPAWGTNKLLHEGNYSSYALPLSGGQMTGPLTWKNGTALPNATTADYLLTIDAFSSGGTTKWIGAANVTVGRATADGNGNTISSTYLKLTGGTLTGSLAVDSTFTCRSAQFKSTDPALGALGNGTISFRGCSNDGNFSEYGCYIWIDWTSGSTKFQGGYSNGTTITLPIVFQPLGGNVGIGTSSPSQKLHVSGNILASGEVTASSDERLKTIVGDGNLDLRYIANAPNILFKWNNGQDDKVHGGSLAQYFLTGAKHFVLGSDKDYYSLNYGALATSMAISIAKEVVKHDDEITRLKKEVVKLRERVAELEERRA